MPKRTVTKTERGYAVLLTYLKTPRLHGVVFESEGAAKKHRQNWPSLKMRVVPVRISYTLPAGRGRT